MEALAGGIALFVVIVFGIAIAVQDVTRRGSLVEQIACRIEGEVFGQARLHGGQQLADGVVGIAEFAKRAGSGGACLKNGAQVALRIVFEAAFAHGGGRIGAARQGHLREPRLRVVLARGEQTAVAQLPLLFAVQLVALDIDHGLALPQHAMPVAGTVAQGVDAASVRQDRLDAVAQLIIGVRHDKAGIRHARGVGQPAGVGQELQKICAALFGQLAQRIVEETLFGLRRGNGRQAAQRIVGVAHHAVRRGLDG